MRHPKPKSPSETAFAFLKANHGRTCFAPCTGQDVRALRAWFELVEVWGTGDINAEQHALAAMPHVLRCMQRSVWPLAKAGIPGVMDWSHEAQLWGRVMARMEQPS